MVLLALIVRSHCSSKEGDSDDRLDDKHDQVKVAGKDSSRPIGVGTDGVGYIAKFLKNLRVLGSL